MPAVVVGTPRGSGSLPAVQQDDSALCELIHPAVTALHRDVAALATGAKVR